MAVQGVTKDYLRIEYDKKDVLYVPVTQLDLLSRYTAPGDSDNVKLSRLGGNDWAKTRKKVKAATELMAKELIELCPPQAGPRLRLPLRRHLAGRF